MTLLMPGHNPPQVTTAALDFEGSKNSFALGPANSNRSPLGACSPDAWTTTRVGKKSSSLTARLKGEGNRASPTVVAFILRGVLSGACCINQVYFGRERANCCV